jgi:hypothetical protein
MPVPTFGLRLTADFTRQSEISGIASWGLEEVF